MTTKTFLVLSTYGTGDDPLSVSLQYLSARCSLSHLFFPLLHVFMYIFIYLFIYVYSRLVFIYTFIHVFIYLSTYLFIRSFIYTFIYVSTGRLVDSRYL